MCNFYSVSYGYPMGILWVSYGNGSKTAVIPEYNCRCKGSNNF